MMLTKTEQLRLALQRALIELEWCHEALGANRKFTRLDVITCAKATLASTSAADDKAYAEIVIAEYAEKLGVAWTYETAGSIP